MAPEQVTANLYLIRHAHADWEPDENRSLSTRGSRGAVRVTELLAALPIEDIVSSPYRRAVQTVAALAVDLDMEIQVEDRFKERTLGDYSSASFEEAVGRTWQDFEFSWPGGESNLAAQRRAIVALEELIGAGSANHCVLATHGNLLALILNYFDPRVGYQFWSKLTMPDVYYLEIVGKREARYGRLWTPDE
jgi:2,3-bisphosphoglycerate-dependent phosphoglycerate mutase